MAHSLTTQDRKRLKRYAGSKGKDHARKVEPGDCADIRQRYSNGEAVDAILTDYDLVRDTLYQHLRGVCSCPNDTEPVETTGGKISEIKCPYNCRAQYATYDKLTAHINCAHSEDSNE